MPEAPPLVRYPCDYEYKVIGKADPGFTEAVISLFHRVLGRPIGPDRVEVVPSGKGRFASVRVTVHLDSEAERVSLYTALSNEPRIVFYL